MAEVLRIAVAHPVYFIDKSGFYGPRQPISPECESMNFSAAYRSKVRNFPRESVLLGSSNGLGWPSVLAEVWSHAECEASAVVAPFVEVCLIVAGTENGMAWRNMGGVSAEAVPKTGVMWLNPAGLTKDIAITSPIPKTLHLNLPKALFDRLKDDFELPNSAATSIRNESGTYDEVIDCLGRSILSELEAETSVSRVYVELASLTLAARLLQKHCDSGVCASRKISTHHLDEQRLRRVLDFMEANVKSDVTIYDLAGIAGYSPFHFARKFTETTGVAPYRYLSRLRLDIAKAELAAGKLPIAEIALNACFSSQASFTRAFRRTTGMTPMEYRRSQR
jgi:AraC family transcriptional regulator